MGAATDEYLFHTSLCHSPFVLFDLKEIFFLTNVYILNRLNPASYVLERVQEIQIFTSVDLFDWCKVDVSISSDWKRISCVPNLNARYLLIKISGEGILHLKEIEIFKDLPVKNGLKFYNGRTGFFDENLIYSVTYNNGFFSICNAILRDIMESPIKPKHVDVTHSFHSFKDSNSNVWGCYFKSPYDFETLTQNDVLSYANQYNLRYDDIEFDKISPYIRSYFSPCDEVLELVSKITLKYSIDYEHTVAVCYRGTDKDTEVTLTPPSEYVKYCLSLKESNPNLRFLIQTDQKQVRDKLLSEISNSFCIHEMPVTDGLIVMHKIISNEKLNFSQHLLAVTLIMSRCGYVVTHTGGVAYFTALFRGNLFNFKQF